MRLVWRSLLGWVICGVLGLICWPAGAWAEEGVSAGLPTSFLGGAFSAPGVEALVGNSRTVEEAARRADPLAVALRDASGAEGLSDEAAERLDGEVFPALMGHLLGGPPALPEGEKIVGFDNGYLARLDVGSKQHALLASTTPIAIESSPGRWAPVDLSLRDVGSAIEPANPLVSVRLPKQLSDGFSCR